MNHPPKRHASDAVFFLRSADNALHHVEQQANRTEASQASNLRVLIGKLAKAADGLEKRL